MARSDVPAFINGDRCEDGKGSIGYVRECKGARGPYPKVYVSQGPRTGEWCWPEKFCRRPSIDWDKNGPSTSCRDCERWFNGGVDPVTGLRRMFCVTCEGFQKKTDTRRSADQGPAEYRWRPKVYASEQARRDAESEPF